MIFRVINVTNATTKTMAFDVYLDKEGGNPLFKMNGLNLDITFDETAIKNSGTITAAKIAESQGIGGTVTVTKTVGKVNIKQAILPTFEGTATSITASSNGTRICSIRLTNSANWSADSDPDIGVDEDTAVITGYVGTDTVNTTNKRGSLEQINFGVDAAITLNITP